MLKHFNRHCLGLLGATLLASTTGMGAVEKTKAQIISEYHTAPGTIVKISKVLSSKTDMPAMKVFMKTPEKRYMLVHLGAEWALLNERLQLTPGDQIIVKGPVIKAGKVTSMIAKSIQKGKKKIVLTK